MAKFLSPPPIGTPAIEGRDHTHSWEMWFQDLWARQGAFAGSYTQLSTREVQCGAGIVVVNGNGVAGNPVISSSITQYTDAMARAAVAGVGYLLAEIDPVFLAWLATVNPANWNTAYGWGNHALAGYLTAIPPHGVTVGWIPYADSSTSWATSPLKIYSSGFIGCAANILDFRSETQADAIGDINNGSYRGSITDYYRSLRIGNGKGWSIALFDGPTSSLFMRTNTVGWGGTAANPVMSAYVSTHGYIQTLTTGAKLDLSTFDSDINIHTSESGSVNITTNSVNVADKIKLDAKSGVTEIHNVPDAGAAVSRFLGLVSDVLKYRTAAEVLRHRRTSGGIILDL